ncbi:MULTISPECIES: FAD/NAD(P)-binding protein [unclassified Caulobacter]|uniref:FAD/NAD(P)-binding protein n=1 Tax=unclassified Caulobacter TaxID=2648921 RepID=UPI0006F28D9A|nr:MULTISPECIES: FAD/NAD(P)-binding protein [unclassified Caulobacter]KQV56896.1 pyridine nucleotide-disulfide oxidoreductase [Caulobacter sp. Root342]KQV72535.1 pyridine nucleotide-disulfide oxidoreductase [Caulobacter sp. Root343]
MPHPPAPVIAVVGAGFSGVMTALNILRRSPDAKVILFERRTPVGLGAAYATHNPGHRLNVRAGNMSAWPDEPGHFVAWLRGRNFALGPADFATRADYGRYLQSLVAEIAEGPEGAGRLVVTPDAVVGIEPGGDGWRLQCAMGRAVTAHAVVLALGNPPPALPPGIGAAFAASHAYVADPWRWNAADLPPGPVMLIGTGLTMVDVALSLNDAQHGRPMLALSRRGLAPLEHDGAPPLILPAPPANDLSPLQAFAWLRRAAAEHGWRTAIDATRPMTQALWRGWSAAQKQAFLRHARPFWEIHRHRLAPQVARRIAAMRATGQLTLAAGKIRTLTLEPDGFALCRWRGRGEQGGYVFRAASVINCTGPTGDVLASTDPLIQELVKRGLARPDPLRLGFDVDESGRVRDVSGQASPTLLAVGPATRGASWEITAVPDIRGQTVAVADTVLAALRP